MSGARGCTGGPARRVAGLRGGSPVAILAAVVSACAPAPGPDATPDGGACPGAGAGPQVAGAAPSGHNHGATAVPVIYQNMQNPYEYNDPKLAILGAPIYSASCARCHGADGHGCGPVAPSLSPPPADLYQSNLYHDDPYFYWRIHGDNVPNPGSAMPAFGGVLSDDDIWRVITYVRWTFVSPGPANP